MPMRLGLVLGVSVWLCTGCYRSPNAASPISDPTNQNVLAWAPCVVVQSPGGAPFTIQMDAARRLQRAGKMTWIRLNTHLDGIGLEYHLEARRMGLSVFSIVH